MHADTRAIERIRQLRREFGRGPVELVIPGRPVVVIVDAEDVGRVLEQAPEPFDPGNREKRASLGQLQLAAAAVEETDAVLRDALQHGHLDAAQFTMAWWRLVRRVVFGERARSSSHAQAIPTDL